MTEVRGRGESKFALAMQEVKEDAARRANRAGINRNAERQQQQRDQRNNTLNARRSVLMPGVAEALKVTVAGTGRRVVSAGDHNSNARNPPAQARTVEMPIKTSAHMDKEGTQGAGAGKKPASAAAKDKPKSLASRLSGVVTLGSESGGAKRGVKVDVSRRLELSMKKQGLATKRQISVKSSAASGVPKSLARRVQLS